MHLISTPNFINNLLFKFDMAMNAQQRVKVRKLVQELKQHRANHTEFVSVYVPAGYDMNKITTHLYQEMGTAENIKSTSTRKNVKMALEKMIQHLKTYYPKTPSHGVAVFSGNVASRDGKEDMKVWSLEPPTELGIRMYRCEKEFVVDVLEGMLQETNVFALVVIDRREATIGLLRGKTIVPLVDAHSMVPGKFKAGGQSAQRFHRVIEGMAKDFYKKVGDMMKDQLLEMKELKGIIIGGPGPTKEDFINGDFITNELKKRIIGVKDLSYTGEYGLQELLDKSQDILALEEVAEEKKYMEQFFTLLAKQPGKVAYGEKEVEEAIQLGMVDTLLVSESLGDDRIDKYGEEADKEGTKLVVISVETREGVQLKELGGIAALLRYEKQY